MKHEKEMIQYIYIYIRRYYRKKGVSQSSRGTKIAERFDESTWKLRLQNFLEYLVQAYMPVELKLAEPYMMVVQHGILY